MAGVDGKAEVRKVSEMQAWLSETAYADTGMNIGPTDIFTLKRHYP